MRTTGLTITRAVRLIQAAPQFQVQCSQKRVFSSFPLARGHMVGRNGIVNKSHPTDLTPKCFPDQEALPFQQGGTRLSLPWQQGASYLGSSVGL